MPSHNPESSHSNEQPLQGWKEIAAHLERDVRTAQRWELDEALPIRRHRTNRRSSVYAYPSELQRWRSSRQAKPADGEASSAAHAQTRRPFLATLAVAAAIAAALLAIWFGPVLSPPSPITEAAQNAVRTELVWAQARGISPQGSVSPDGKFVTYVDWIDEGNLAVRNLETGEARRLTDTATAVTSNVMSYTMDSRVSPNGKQVAYGWDRPSPAGETGELRVLPLDGEPGAPRTLLNPLEGSYASPEDWFPDGERILAMISNSSDHQIVTVSLPDGEVQQIRSFAWGDRPRARVSPDGRYIAYSRSASRDEAAKDVFLVAADGSSEIAVVQHAANDELVGWSPDEDYLLINSDRSGQPGLWALPLKDGAPAGELELIVPNVDVGAGMGFARDGSLYYSVRVSERRLKLAEVDLRTGKLVAEPENAVEQFLGRNQVGAFSPDGKEFAYLSAREGWNRSAIIVRSLATGAERKLEHDLQHVFSLMWPADHGGLIVQGHDYRDRYGLFRLADGKAELIAEGGAGVLSPDGEYLFFIKPDPPSGDMSLHSYRLADRSVEEVSADFGSSRFSVLPDGRIASLYGRTEIRLHPVGGGDTEVLWSTDERHPFARRIVWAPAVEALLVLRQDPEAGKEAWRLWVAPTDGSPPYPTELVRENAGAIAVHPERGQMLYQEGSYYYQVWAMRGLPFEARDPE